jgi:hypothetical protein
MNMSFLRAGLIALGLATAIHLDWHVARPAHHHLSLGWRWHWLLAVPVFGVGAWLVARTNPQRAVVWSAVIIGLAALLGGVLEPAWEYWLAGATFEWAFGRLRTVAFFGFTAIGVATWIGVFALMRRGRRM